MKISKKDSNMSKAIKDNTADRIYLKIFSYGSNHMNQLKTRIEKESDIDFNSAYISNYTRIFAGYSKRWNGGVASIYPNKGDRVYGSVFYLTKDEIEKLDKFEGGYTRSIINIMEKLNGEYQASKAFVYIKIEIYYSHFPSEDYLLAILKMHNESDREEKKNISIRGIDENNEIKEISVWCSN